MKKLFVYLDDVRTPIDPAWTVLRSYDEFVEYFSKTSLENVEIISFDHDLGPRAMKQYFDNVVQDFSFDYDQMEDEKTGYDAAKWLIEYAMSTNQTIPPQVFSHSANPIGAANIIGILNAYFARHRLPQTAIRTRINHTVKK